MKFCTNCGAKLEAHMVFCTYCGTQAGKPPMQQTNPSPVHHAGIHNYAGKNTNYIIAIVAIALIGIVIFINQGGNQGGSSGLVGTWERQGADCSLTFSRGGTGLLKTDHFRTNVIFSFSWEAIEGTLVIMGPYGSRSVIEFEVVGSSLIIPSGWQQSQIGVDRHGMFPLGGNWIRQ